MQRGNEARNGGFAGKFNYSEETTRLRLTTARRARLGLTTAWQGPSPDYGYHGLLGPPFPERSISGLASETGP